MKVDLKTFITNGTLKTNVGDYIKNADTNNDGIFSQKEVKAGIKGGTTLWAKPMVTDKVANSVMENVDRNGDGNLSKDELAAYLKDNYGMKMEDAEKMTVGELIDCIQNKNAKAKKK